MMTEEEIKGALNSIKQSLIKAHGEIVVVADSIESKLKTDKEFADSRVYGAACRTLGILEERIAAIGSQLTNLR